MKKTELETIQEILNTCSAMQYADAMLLYEKENYSLTTYNTKTGSQKIEKPSYDEFMLTYWGSGTKPKLKDCIEASWQSKLARYGQMIKMYHGWRKHGRIFVLNKREKFVCFLYEIATTDNTLSGTPKSVSLSIHYNPLNVDIIEEHMSYKNWLKLLDNKRDYEVGTDGNKLCGQLNLMVNQSIQN